MTAIHSFVRVILETSCLPPASFFVLTLPFCVEHHLLYLTGTCMSGCMFCSWLSCVVLEVTITVSFLCFGTLGPFWFSAMGSQQGPWSDP